MPLVITCFRFTNNQDTQWFLKTLRDTALSYLAGDGELFDDGQSYFVDFLRDVPDATGDEPDDFVLEAPKIYEEIPR